MKQPLVTINLKDGRRFKLFYDMDSGDPRKDWDSTLPESDYSVQAWKNGEIYGFTLEGPEKTCKCCKHTSREVLDSCWGFYGYKHAHNAIPDHLDEKTAKELKKAGFHA